MLEENLEQVLNYACSKIVEQGYRCMQDTVCMYGDSEGGHCAVGWLLDEEDDELMNYQGVVGELLDDHRDRIPDYIGDNLDAFEALQSFHDTEGQSCRVHALQELREITGFKLDEPHWQQWIEMGEVHED